MSNLEIARNSSPVYAYTFPAMGAGTITTTNDKVFYAATSLVNFRPSCSKIVGLELVTAGGVPSPTAPILTVTNIVNSTADGYLPQLTLRSVNNVDTSVYVMFWINEVASSPYQTITIC
jgi:hypothetical protein